MNRCPECGSWGSQCASDTPVKDCGCARCANARAVELQKKYDELTGEKFSDRSHAALKSRAETAEARAESAETLLKRVLAETVCDCAPGRRCVHDDIAEWGKALGKDK